MTEGILTALITGGLALGGTVGSAAMSSRLTNYRIKALEAKFDELNAHVREHNHLKERMAAVEQSAQSAQHRLDQLDKYRDGR